MCVCCFFFGGGLGVGLRLVFFLGGWVGLGVGLRLSLGLGLGSRVCVLVRVVK